MTDFSGARAPAHEGGSRPPTGVRRHLFRLAPLVLVGIGLFAALSARALDVGSLTDPGPGMWPVVVSLVTTVSAALLVWRDVPEDYETWSRTSLLVITGVLVLGVFIELFEVLGFPLAAFILLFVWLKGLAGERWWVALSLAVLGGVGLELIFAGLFEVPFPPGLMQLGVG